jgi:hypothetical protein
MDNYDLMDNFKIWWTMLTTKRQHRQWVGNCPRMLQDPHFASFVKLKKHVNFGFIVYSKVSKVKFF